MQCQKFYKQVAAQAETHIVLLLLLHSLPGLRVSLRGVCFRLCKTLLMSRGDGGWIMGTSSTSQLPLPLNQTKKCLSDFYAVADSIKNSFKPLR